jgi:hypothetical protein
MRDTKNILSIAFAAFAALVLFAVIIIASAKVTREHVENRVSRTVTLYPPGGPARTWQTRGGVVSRDGMAFFRDEANVDWTIAGTFTVQLNNATPEKP